jgi:1-deoxy-D-xylulose-5-phosphate reductoisomerase
MPLRSSADRVLRVALLGSTGSIGRQAIDVLEAHADRFRVTALAAGRNAAELERQAHRLRPTVIALADESRTLDLPSGTERIGGAGALEALATHDDVDIVVVGTTGIHALRPVLAALEAGRIVATANKEAIVAGGHLVMARARALANARAGEDPLGAGASPLSWLRPIDSEHSAIWQSLAGERMGSIDRLLLTASGGPFLDTAAADLAAVTPEQALRHPTWQMGAKITIDSATMVNKGLEVIEAHWLYDVAYDAIEVVIHPQSVVHSAVAFIDGSLKAQLGTPDMRLPIQYALTYPERLSSSVAPPDLVAAARLEFRAPDEARFPALRIAREAGRIGSRASAALIAADDVAVDRFLEGTISFNEIPVLLEAAVARFGAGADQAPDVATLVALDREIRAAFATGPVGGVA